MTASQAGEPSTARHASASSADIIPISHSPGGTMTNDLPPMPDTPPSAPKPVVKRRPGLIIAAVTAAAVAIGGTAYWISRPSYDDIVKGCQKALTAQSKAGGKGKPDACKDVKKDDYDALVMASVIDGMSKKDRDLLDYYDDGSINGSLR